MKHLLILIVALALPASAQAAPKHKRHQPRAHVAQHQIACTQFGCIPVRQRRAAPSQDYRATSMWSSALRGHCTEFDSRDTSNASS